MITDWIKNLQDKKDQDEFKASIQNAGSVLDRVAQLIEERINSLGAPEKNYTSPSWAYLQAHVNGRKEELEYFKKLVTERS